MSRIPTAYAVVEMVGFSSQAPSNNEAVGLLNPAVTSSAAPAVVLRPQLVRTNVVAFHMFNCCLCLVATVGLTIMFQNNPTTDLKEKAITGIFSDHKSHQTVLYSFLSAVNTAVDVAVIFSAAFCVTTYCVNHCREAAYNFRHRDNKNIPESHIAPSVFSNGRMQHAAVKVATSLMTVATLWSLTAIYKPENFYEAAGLLPATAIMTIAGQCGLSVILSMMRAVCMNQESALYHLMDTAIRSINPLCTNTCLGPQHPDAQALRV
jgi:hypothetical protein